MAGALLPIVNGAAGGGKCASLVREALSHLSRSGVDLLPARYTERAGHATEIAREAFRGGQREFLAVGGDGTSYEIVNGLFPEAQDSKVKLSLLPLGTGNSFLRDFGIHDHNAARAAIVEAVRKARTTAVDVVEAKHRDGSVYFINLLGLGFTAIAGDLMNRRFKKLGTAGYVAAVLTTTARLTYPVDPIRVDGGTRDDRPAAFLVFSNSQFTGGAMHMAPGASVSDGVVDLIRCGEIGRLGLLSTFPKIFKGSHVTHPKVSVEHAKRVEFLEPRMQPCMIDGEVVWLELKELVVHQHALEIGL